MKKSQKYQILLLILVSTFLFFFRLNQTYLTNWDEAWYAAIAKQMALKGDFITPIYNGKTWFAASPLYLWLVAIWFKIFGFSSLGARFFSSFFSVLTIFITYLIGKKLFSHKTGIISVIVLVSTIQFLYRGRTGNLDATLTFFITLAFYFYLKSKEQKKWLHYFGVSSGLAFLSKGLFGLFPLILLVTLSKKDILKVLFSFVAITLPWHLAAYFANGSAFIDHYFAQYMFSKATVANPVSGLDIFWYISTLKHGLKLWFPIFMVGFFYCLYSFRKNRDLKYILLWFILPFTAITIARMRNDWYVFFLYPSIALVSGYFIKNAFHKVNKYLMIGVVIFISTFNLIKYRSSYIVPETVAAEVLLAIKAKELTKTEETILLDDNYLPVAVYYSDRIVIPLRYSREKSSLVSDESLKEATNEANRKIVLTNTETKDQLLNRLNNPDFQILKQKDDKILMELKFLR